MREQRIFEINNAKTGSFKENRNERNGKRNCAWFVLL